MAMAMATARAWAQRTGARSVCGASQAHEWDFPPQATATAMATTPGWSSHSRLRDEKSACGGFRAPVSVDGER